MKIRNQMKKWIASLCVFAMIFSLVPSAFADGETESTEFIPVESTVTEPVVNIVVVENTAPAPVSVPAADPAPVSVPAADPAPVSVPAADPTPVSVPTADPAPVSVPAADPAPVSVPAAVADSQVSEDPVTESSDGKDEVILPSAQLMSSAPARNAALSSALLSTPAAVEPSEQETDQTEQPVEEADPRKTSTGLLVDRPAQSEEINTTVGSSEYAKNPDLNAMSDEESFNIFFNQDTGVYSITYTIQEGTDASELTIDFTKALEALASYAGMSESNTLEPGDSRVFEIYIQSDSQHVYKYQQGSFVLTTPEIKTETDIGEAETSGISKSSRAIEERLTFDEQVIENEGLYTPLTARFPAFRQALIDFGIPASDIDRNLVWRSDLNRFIKNHSTEELEQMVLDYYNVIDGKADGEGYPDIQTLFRESEQAVKDIFASSTNTAGNNEILTFQDAVDAVTLYDNMYKNIMYAVYGEEDVKSALGNDAVPTRTHTSVKTVYSVTDYDDMSEYPECYPANELGSYYVNIMKRYGLPEDTLVSIDSSGRIIFGFATEDGEIATASNSTPGKKIITSQAEYENSDWRFNEDSTINSATVGEYMKGEESEIWRKADAYFAQLLSEGISESEATQLTKEMVNFMMAANINFDLAGNNYQDTEWGFHNTIKLERVDGELNLTKTDENGEPISKDETTFQLWRYEDTDHDNLYTEKDDKYFYTSWQKDVLDEESGETRQETTYGFLKYDPENTSLTYTIDTTNGELNIDYAMLEGIIYYLQETVAPEGYELDTKIYIICDDEEKAAQAEEMLQDAGITVKKNDDGSIAEDAFVYAGAINSEKPLEITVVNVSIPVPEPDPTPDQPVVPPVPPLPGEGGNNPQGGLMEIDDFMTPLAGAMIMNEGDCIN